MEENDTATVHGRPCVSCRKRKVRCDKSRPCSNCTKAKQLCTYDSLEADSTISAQARIGSTQTDGDLRERLARLEGLMVEMMDGDSVSGRLQASQSTLNQTSAQQLLPYTPPATVGQSGAPVGQIVFQEGYSAYFDSDYWPVMISEIEDLRQLFDAPKYSNREPSWTSSSPLGLAIAVSVTDPSSLQPTLGESNMLCRFYFENVDPFLKLLYQTHFAKELDQFRRGIFGLPHEYEALLFCVYLLAINSLWPEVVSTTFSAPKPVLLARFQKGAELALAGVNFFTTDKILVLQALLHYLTFLFHQNQIREAVALLANAARTAQNMGIHRDPSHFPYSPWICELRRRAWNSICCLNAVAVHSYGSESCLPQTADAQPPRNADDNQWHASRFAKPASVPLDAKGFKETTFVLARRKIADLTIELSQLDPQDFAAKDRLIRNAKVSLDEKYLNEISGTSPSQNIIAAMIEVSILSLRLTLRHRRTMQATAVVRDREKYDEFIESLELLEAIEYHLFTFAPLSWEWIFRAAVLWLATALVLTYTPHASRRVDIDRAQKHINLMFQRYSDPTSPLLGCSSWQLLVRLRAQVSQTGRLGNAATWEQQQNVSSEQGILDPGLILSDDLISGFGAINQMELLGDEMDFQDMPGLPW